MTIQTASRPIPLGHTFRDLFPELGTDWQAEQVTDPQLVVLNKILAAELGLDAEWLDSADGIKVLAGTDVPPQAQPIAMAYAGHQFGHYSPRLGDGRALLLGEIDTGEAGIVDLHLKGSGRTPYARGGDGKAALGPMLREYLKAEAMYALGVPTSRALSVVTTGESVMRERPLPGAILTRVAPSHLRVGTFQYAASLQADNLVQRLADHSISRHYPDAARADNPYLSLLESVIDRQAQVVARWMLVGFIHGVMNTDNMTISGHTIDYGPCAFMEAYDPTAVFSSIDHAGRYAYGNQPGIAQWNLARLAETLLPLIDPEQEEAIGLAVTRLERFSDLFSSYWNQGMRAKLGLAPKPAASDPSPSKPAASESGQPQGADELADSLLVLMKEAGADYTNTFRALASYLRGDHDPLGRFLPGVGDPTSPTRAWLDRWDAELTSEGRSPQATADSMDQVNPLFIPRNHLVEAALSQGEQGDLTLFHQLLAVVSDPFKPQPAMEHYSRPAPKEFTSGYQTFCGT